MNNDKSDNLEEALKIEKWKVNMRGMVGAGGGGRTTAICLKCTPGRNTLFRLYQTYKRVESLRVEVEERIGLKAYLQKLQPAGIIGNRHMFMAMQQI